jgi:proteasome accessory factor B
LTRLFKLVAMLQSERHPNARELAEGCEVSRRTIYRDLDVLVAAGIPVRYRQESQGYQIAKGFFLPPANLSELEALALTVLSRQWEGGDALGLLRAASQGAVKLVQGLPAEVRDRVLVAAEPFHDRPEPDERVSGRRSVHDTILGALARQRQLRLWFRDPSTNASECTKFSIYRLILHDRHWFLVGRSSWHRRVEVIGLPWVSRAELTDDVATMPPRFRLGRFLAQSWGVERSPSRYAVRLRFSPRVAPLALDGVWHRSQREEFVPGGGVDLKFVVDGLDEIVRWILGFGAEVEVLEPAALRDRLYRVASQIAETHGSPGPAQAVPRTSASA